jgi:5-deoxy-glucuronate isomerase
VNGQPFVGVGGRKSVFAGPPSLVYAPCRARVAIQATTKAEIALCSSLSSSEIAPYRIDPADCFQGKWGRFNTTRTFSFMIDQRRPSERLHVAEVIAPSGNWAT